MAYRYRTQGLVGPYQGRSPSTTPHAPTRKRARTDGKREQRKTIVLRGVTAFANRVTVTLKYTEQFALSGAAGAMGYAYYRANGMYDPDVAVGGHQPYAFDQWMAMYKNYCVHKSSIDVSCAPDSLSNGVILAVQSDTDFAVTPTTLAQVCERPTVSWAIANNNEHLRLKRTATTESELGIPKKLQIADDRICGSVGGNPALMWYWRIFGQPSQPLEAWQCNVFMTIYVTCTFFNHYEPGAS